MSAKVSGKKTVYTQVFLQLWNIVSKLQTKYRLETAGFGIIKLYLKKLLPTLCLTEMYCSSLVYIYESFECLFVCLYLSGHIRCLIKYTASPLEHSLLQRDVLYPIYFLGFLFIRASSLFKKKLLLSRKKKKKNYSRLF